MRADNTIMSTTLRSFCNRMISELSGSRPLDSVKQILGLFYFVVSKVSQSPGAPLTELPSVETLIHPGDNQCYELQLVRGSSSSLQTSQPISIQNLVFSLGEILFFFLTKSGRDFQPNQPAALTFVEGSISDVFIPTLHKNEPAKNVKYQTETGDLKTLLRRFLIGDNQFKTLNEIINADVWGKFGISVDERAELATGKMMEIRDKGAFWHDVFRRAQEACPKWCEIESAPAPVRAAAPVPAPALQAPRSSQPSNRSGDGSEKSYKFVYDDKTGRYIGDQLVIEKLPETRAGGLLQTGQACHALLHVRAGIPGGIRIFQVSLHNKKIPCVYYERIHGATLTDVYSELARLEKSFEWLKDVFAIFFSVLCAVKKLHDQGIAHLNLKPDNILVTPDGQIYLVGLQHLRSGKINDRRSLNALRSIHADLLLPPEAKNANPGNQDYFDPGIDATKVDVYSLGWITDGAFGNGVNPVDSVLSEIPEFQNGQGMRDFFHGKMFNADPGKRSDIGRLLLDPFWDTVGLTQERRALLSCAPNQRSDAGQVYSTACLAVFRRACDQANAATQSMQQVSVSFPQIDPHPVAPQAGSRPGFWHTVPDGDTKTPNNQPDWW